MLNSVLCVGLLRDRYNINFAFFIKVINKCIQNTKKKANHPKLYCCKIIYINVQCRHYSKRAYAAQVVGGWEEGTNIIHHLNTVKFIWNLKENKTKGIFKLPINYYFPKKKDTISWSVTFSKVLLKISIIFESQTSWPCTFFLSQKQEKLAFLMFNFCFKVCWLFTWIPQIVLCTVPPFSI